MPTMRFSWYASTIASTTRVVDTWYGISLMTIL